MTIGLNKQLLMDFDELPYSLAPNAKSREPSPARSRPVEAKGFGQEWIQRCMKNCATLRNEPVVVTREMIQYFPWIVVVQDRALLQDIVLAEPRKGH